jgi:UDP-N-acetylmuramate dehydrogenase
MDKRGQGTIRKRLDRACPGGVREDEPMSSHTTIGASGPARFFAVPMTTTQVVSLVRAAVGLGLDYIGIGKGSNLLVRDGGYDGLVIQVAANLARLAVYSRTAHAEAGLSFTKLGKTLTREGRPGFEFAVGIPGSVGGAVRMNAGAWGADVSGVLKSVKVIDGAGRVHVLGAGDLGLRYRKSELPPRSIVLGAVFNCPPGPIDEEMLGRSMSRGKTQPLAQKSFGSTFKNPKDGFAGRLIEECGLKGVRRGGVMVSEKHANFLVNIGEDTKANDIEDLVGWIIEKVEARFNVRLSPEVIIIGNR